MCPFNTSVNFDLNDPGIQGSFKGHFAVGFQSNILLSALKSYRLTFYYEVLSVTSAMQN